jgi:hypothetical protein
MKEIVSPVARASPCALAGEAKRGHPAINDTVGKLSGTPSVSGWETDKRIGAPYPFIRLCEAIR